jgi:phenylalanyl-tRNA synthetase beta chain
LLRTVRGADRALIAQASLFDVYEGDKIEPSMKSIGIEIVLQPREKTLTDAEIEAVSARIVHAATKIGASLR